MAQVETKAQPAEQPIFRVVVAGREQEAAHQSLSGYPGLTGYQPQRLYFLQGQLTAGEVEQLAQALLADPVTEQAEKSQLPNPKNQTEAGEESKINFVDVTFLPGVTDAAADNLLRAARLLGIAGLARAATGQRFVVAGAAEEGMLHRLAVERLANPVIQRYTVNQPITPPFVPFQTADETVEAIPLCAANDEQLLAISAERRLALNLAEMQAIRAYFQTEEREPTDVELETLAQTWSEHCVHKTFKAIIDYTGPAGADPNGPPVPQRIDGLLKSYIRRATEEVNKPWVRSAFVDNAGIVAFDENFDLAFKVETHNHPSALEPFGGANTGVGGVVRDVLGVSARPIANTDILCFGPPDLPAESVPTGVLPPQRIAEGVIHGVEDYGNKMGIPTVNGAIYYHPGYTANPLVYCGCLGILPRGSHPAGAQPHDLIVAIGGRTGRDGLRGATFSSMEMDQATGAIAGSAVQIGNPIQEKQVLEVVLQAREEQLYNAITDCGAGGFSSAVGEMGSQLGARVQLASVLPKYPGLRPWELWLSEAQERMVLAVPLANWLRLRELCASHDVEAILLGEFEPSGRLRLFYQEQPVGDLAMEFLHDGIPQRHLKAEWANEEKSQIPNPKSQERGTQGRDMKQLLLDLLAHPNIRSKEAVIRLYDHEVQGGTAVKPLVGADNHGPSDAAVLVPLDSLLQEEAQNPKSLRAVALANGINPLYGELDPYAMAWAAVDEAFRNLVAVGADPDQVALLDNFCWGNPNLPDRLGSLVRCAQGCYDAAVAYNAPYISGKDSLNNEYTGADGRKHAIPGTLLISALGIVPSVEQTVTMALKEDGSFIYVIGETRPELGGSHYGLLQGAAGGQPPQPLQESLTRYRALHQAIRAGLVLAAHDCSEGGLAVALAEMALAGRCGLNVDLAHLPVSGEVDDAARLFAESLGRLVIEVRSADAPAFEEQMKAAAVPFGRIGQTNHDGFRIANKTMTLIESDWPQLEAAWRGAKSEAPGAKSAEQRADNNTQYPIRNTSNLTPHPSSPRVLILHANGTNRDREAALACRTAGGDPEIVHVNQLIAGERNLLDYHMLVLPGGFSYGDDLGAGTLWALDTRHRLGEAVTRFIADGRPVLGICNGFQALVKAGLLPGDVNPKSQVPNPNLQSPISNLQPPNPPIPAASRPVTLTFNQEGHFECRWVYLRPNPTSTSLFTEGLEEWIYCPVAHGEGRLVAQDDGVAAALEANGLVALSYVNEDGTPAVYPANPNGSLLNIAGLSNAAGNVLGLMPHPEDHLFPWQHPRRHNGTAGMTGLKLFENGIKRA
jgi:phosphoribosylformylglycinamidine synthase II/phosphoribosylformylglycinamidine synthase I